LIAIPDIGGAKAPGYSDADTPPPRCGHVAIIGRPSVGKSTLLNALLSQKLSITSNKPQTTRHRITGILTEKDAQFIFVDTPGFQTLHRSRLNERLNRAVRESLAQVDVVVLVLDAARIVAADREVIALLPSDVAVIAALNKTDRLKDTSVLLPRLAEVTQLHPFTALIPVSAEKGSQLTALKAEIARALPEEAPIYPADHLTDRDERFLAAEFIREKIFRLLGDEVPYATTVGIDSLVQEGDLRRIRATVYVAKTGQRGMVLGESGLRMKAIASQARADMERLFGGRVFLEVWVRVKPKWAESDQSLTRYGY